MIDLINILNTTGAGFCRFALAMLTQSGILIVLLYLIDLLIRKHVRAVFRYCIWMLVFVKLVLPTSLSLPTGVGYWWGDYLSGETAVSEYVSDLAIGQPAEMLAPESAAIPAEMAQVQQSQVSIETVAPVTSSSLPLPAVTWQAGVFLAWLVGVLILSVLLIQRAWFVKGLIAQSSPAQGRLPETLEQCRKQIGVRKNIELRLSKNMLSPAACGLARPIILMPASLLEKLSREKLRAVLIHELAHIKRGDLWVNLAQTLLQIIYFYNPLLWLANAIVRRIREQAVDEMVLVSLGDEAASYSDTLIDIAEIAFVQPMLSLRLIGVVESKKTLKARIKHILNRPIPKTAKLGFVGLIGIIITALILLPMAKAEKGTAEVPYESCQAVYDFDGVNDYLEVPDNKELDIVEAFTAELWVKVHGVTGEDAIVSKEVPWKSGWTLIVVPKGGVRERKAVSDSRIDAKLYSLTFAVGDGNRFYNLTSLPCLEKDKWHHVAATWAKGKGTIYVDGQFICSQVFPPAAPARVPLRIGQGSANLGRHFNGELADIRLWNTVRSIKEINKKKNSRLSGKESDLAACWVSPPNSDGIVHDISPNVNDGRIIDSNSVSKLNLKSDVQIEVEKSAVQVEGESGVVKQASSGAGEEETQGSKLEFRILPDSVLSSRAPSPLRLENEMEYRKDMRENGPDVGRRRGDEYIWLEVEKYEPAKFSLLVIEKIGEKSYVLAANLKNKMMLANGTWGLQKVYPKQDYMGRPGIGFEFDEKSDNLFYQFTSSNINNRLAIIIDGKIYSAPQINSAIRGEGIITGDFTEAEVAKVIGALKKGMPAVAPKPRGQRPGFDPVVEITINDNVAVRKDSLVDFDTGKLFSPPDDWYKTPDSNKALQWIISNGVDACGATRNTVRGLDCEGMIFVSARNSYWDKFQARSLATSDLWKMGKPGRPAQMTAQGQLPVTYMFKTREGGIGILQITGFNDEPRGVNIRYQMLKNYNGPNSAEQVE